MAMPPILGIGRVCTRGRSVGTSTAPMRAASRTVSGVSAKTMLAASKNPHTARPSPTRVSSDSVNDMGRL